MFSGSLNSNTDQLYQYVLAVIVQFFFLAQIILQYFAIVLSQK